VRKNKLVSVLAAAGLAVATLGFTASTSHAAVFQVRLYVSADTNVENLYLKELIPAFEKAFPNYQVDLSSFDLHGKNDALEFTSQSERKTCLCGHIHITCWGNGKFPTCKLCSPE
jgi:SET domain-containing protein